MFVPALLLLFWLTACGARQGQLKPLRATPTPGGPFSAQPQLVTFLALQEDPEAYKDKLVRVSGAYYILPPTQCLPKSGPNAQWALIADDLRLDTLGFEGLMKLIAPDTDLTIDGYFRFYEGPIGCGKDAPESTAWYLEAIQIVQPNSLAASDRPSGGGFVVGEPSSQPTIFGSGQATPQTTPAGATSSPSATPTTSTVIPTGTVTATATPTSTSSPTGTLASSTATRPGTATTPQGTPGSATGTATLTPTSTATASPSVPTPTDVVGGYPPPPSATATLSGYPPQLPATATSAYP